MGEVEIQIKDDIKKIATMITGVKHGVPTPERIALALEEMNRHLKQIAETLDMIRRK